MGEIPARVSDDAINPSHYKSHPSGVECIQITEHMSFLIGNAMKYLWRAGLKTEDPLEDLEKARWYLDRQIALLASKDDVSEEGQHIGPRVWERLEDVPDWVRVKSPNSSLIYRKRHGLIQFLEVSGEWSISNARRSGPWYEVEQ